MFLDYKGRKIKISDKLYEEYRYLTGEDLDDEQIIAYDCWETYIKKDVPEDDVIAYIEHLSDEEIAKAVEIASENELKDLRPTGKDIYEDTKERVKFAKTQKNCADIP